MKSYLKYWIIFCAFLLVAGLEVALARVLHCSFLNTIFHIEINRNRGKLSHSS